jgi:hypothetical protein
MHDMRLLRWMGLDLVPDYFVALYEQWHAILWGASVPAVIFFLWWTLGLPPIAAIVVWFVTALFFAGYFVWRANHLRLIPRFKIGQLHLQPSPNQVGRSVWIQVEPECLTEAAIEQCQGWLLRVMHRWPSNSGIGTGEWEPTSLNEPQILGWSLGDYSPVTLYPGIPQRLNVFWIYSEQKLFPQPCVDRVPLRAYEVLTQQGSFRFELQLRAKDCLPVYIAIEYEPGDPWDQPHTRLVQFSLEKKPDDRKRRKAKAA